MLIYNPLPTRSKLLGIFLLWALLSGLFTACTAETSPPAVTPGATLTPITPTPTLEAQTALPAAAQPENTPTSAPGFVSFAPPYGIRVEAAALCTDGVNTTLVLHTELNPAAWLLDPAAFFPAGRAYFETGIVFLENGNLFSNTSSGKREDPVFNPLSQTLRVMQTFIFPQPLQEGAVYTFKAKVTLLDLPPNYTPKKPVGLLEPGIVEVPWEYGGVVVPGRCP